MRRYLAFLFGISSYGIFFATFLYLIGFLANAFVPKGIDTGMPGDAMVALTVNAGLIALFGLQHSIMARRGFKAIAVRHEERDLVRYHGKDYVEYQRRVPKFVPRLGAAHAAIPPASKRAATSTGSH